MFELPQVTAPPKPKYGEPCNGCGFCCAAEVCWVGKAALQDEDAQGPCTFMVFDEADARFYCGLVREPERFFPNQVVADCLKNVSVLLLGIGKGCDSELASERR